MKSMTGFGRAVASLGSGSVVVQVNSVNRKTLDLTMRLPEAWAALESKIAEAVREVATRGKVHVQVGMEAASGDEAKVEAALERLRRIADANGLPFQPDARLLWDIANDRRASVEPELDEAVEDAVLSAVEEALRAFAAMRAKEGEALLIDFLTRIGILRTNVAAVAERAPQVAPAYRELLFKRLREADLELDPSDERVLKEVALFADRSDITEELTRLKSHLQQLEALLKTDGEIGRKGEFILQEIGREIHTIGSKANDLEISKHVIELKNELERVREQIANVE
ncbi:YicC/YloC family endoribonuclease [Actomonas aquatica]|uniref:YicC/YloC family endoribonuclease n=1 Tax=Actomonas aquatica TaxID=2866162 RepID=A0ABZ1CBQ2_9BACT|nr:YicC/YloC family endoribonuclease [Opitutus sp. WL0086]WRQ88862.1 YicC/YloC family endoribonuclease [Opitutus sp. WL0086]